MFSTCKIDRRTIIGGMLKSFRGIRVHLFWLLVYLSGELIPPMSFSYKINWNLEISVANETIQLEPIEKTYSRPGTKLENTISKHIGKLKKIKSSLVEDDLKNVIEEIIQDFNEARCVFKIFFLYH